VPNYLLIDANSIGFAAQDAPKLYVGEDEVQSTYGFVRKMRVVLKEFAGYIPIVLWDGRAQWRFDLFPQYKGNRNVYPERVKEKDAYKSQHENIKRAMSALGVTQVTDKEAEADDLAAYFSRKLGADKRNKIVMVSGDKDWCQLVTENVSWYCHKTQRRCGIDNFEEFTGYATPRLFVEGKCLTGDGSDNVPGVGNIGDKGAPEFLDKYGSVAGFISQRDKGLLPDKLPAAHKRLRDNIAPNPSKKYGEMLPAHDAFVRNKELMNLMGDWKPNKATTVMISGNYSYRLFKEFCEDMMFNTILKQLSTWVVPFKNVAKG